MRQRDWGWSGHMLFKETRWIHSQEGHRKEPTGEVPERETPAHLEAHKNGGAGGETVHMTRK